MRTNHFPIGFWNYRDWPEDIAERVRESEDLQVDDLTEKEFTESDNDPFWMGK